MKISKSLKNILKLLIISCIAFSACFIYCVKIRVNLLTLISLSSLLSSYIIYLLISFSILYEKTNSKVVLKRTSLNKSTPQYVKRAA